MFLLHFFHFENCLDSQSMPDALHAIVSIRSTGSKVEVIAIFMSAAFSVKVRVSLPRVNAGSSSQRVILVERP